LVGDYPFTLRLKKDKWRFDLDKKVHIDDQVSSEFKLERYKYILQEIRSLNENVHRYLALYQTLATAIVAGGIGIFVSWKSLKIDVEIARAAIQGSLVLFILLTFFVIFSTIANIISWFDYRKEEVKLLDKIVKPNFREPPSLRNFWRWSETYILLFMIAIVIVLFFFVEYLIIPLIK
jgi:hypothetical protein